MTKLTDQEVIRKGVELCPGWELEHHENGSIRLWYSDINCWVGHFEQLPHWILAVLAADLVDMVDGLDVFLSVHKGWVAIRDRNNTQDIVAKYGPDRRLNTIHAVVAFYEARPELKQ